MYRLALGLALALNVAVAQANTVQFYEREASKFWDVVGYGKTTNGGYSRCSMRTFGPGLGLSIDRDLDDGENLMWFSDRNATFSERDGNTAFITFNGRRLPNNRVSGPSNFDIIAPNVIVFRKLPDAFFDLVGNAATMEIRLPGPIQPIDVNMDGTSRAIGFMNDCIRVYRSHGAPSQPAPKIDPHIPPPTIRNDI